MICPICLEYLEPSVANNQVFVHDTSTYDDRTLWPGGLETNENGVAHYGGRINVCTVK